MKIPALHADILCLDVAFANLGIAIWNQRQQKFSHGQVLTTTPEKKSGGKRHVYVSDDNVRRCQHLADELVAIMARFGTRTVLAEMPTGGGQNSKAVQAMGMALAVVSAVCALRGVSLHTIQPSETKKLVGAKGNGKIDKVLVQNFIEKIQPGFLSAFNKGQREHVADAAICIEIARRSPYLRGLLK